MKKVLIFVFAAMMLLSLSACATGSSDEGQFGGANPAMQEKDKDKEKDDKKDKEEKDDKASKSGRQEYYKEKEREGIISEKDITLENWHQVVKENYELDLQLPEGWEITETVSLMGSHLTFSCNTDSDTVEAWFDGIFAQLKENGSLFAVAHDTDRQHASYTAANTDGWQTNFDFCMNAEFSKELYIDFDYHTTLDEQGNWFVDEVGLYISADGDWSAPSGDHGLQKLEAYTGMEDVPAPEGYTVSIYSAFYDESLSMAFATEEEEAAEADLDAYAAKIYELCEQAADKKDIFWYHTESKKITIDYDDVSQTKKSDTMYAWFYKLDGEYIYIRVRRSGNKLFVDAQPPAE